MKKTKFTEQQIAFALRQAETGTRVAEVCRKLGISDATFYNWKKKYGGLGVSELRRLKQLEEENRQLKRMVADLSLDKQMLQDVLAKMYGPPRVCKTINWRGKSGLRKCIRPVYGTRRCGHDGDPHVTGLSRETLIKSPYYEIIGKSKP